MVPTVAEPEIPPNIEVGLPHPQCYHSFWISSDWYLASFNVWVRRGGSDQQSKTVLKGTESDDLVQWPSSPPTLVCQTSISHQILELRGVLVGWYQHQNELVQTLPSLTTLKWSAAPEGTNWTRSSWYQILESRRMVIGWYQIWFTIDTLRYKAPVLIWFRSWDLWQRIWFSTFKYRHWSYNGSLKLVSSI